MDIVCEKGLLSELLMRFLCLVPTPVLYTKKKKKYYLYIKAFKIHSNTILNIF